MADDKRFVQVELKHQQSVMVCWLEQDPRVREGANLSLKLMPEVLWRVSKVYETKSVKPSDAHDHWKVGGITPKR